jgi:hypothetical protein
MSATERVQLAQSTDAELADRLAALRERYDPKRDGGCFPAGGYPMAQLRELHLIEAEQAERRQILRDRFRLDVEEESERSAPDNHSALFDATDIEWSLKYGR